VAIIDDVVGSRRSDAAPPSGPTSPWPLSTEWWHVFRLAFADWWAKTAGERSGRSPRPGGARPPEILGTPWTSSHPSSSSRSKRRIAKPWCRPSTLISRPRPRHDQLATYIDSANERAPIAQRGQCKQKRNDLRLVGPGPGGEHRWCRSHCSAMPMPATNPDVTQFADVLSELLTRWSALPRTATDSRWSMTPARTQRPTRPRSPPAPCTSSVLCRPPKHLDLLAYPSPAVTKSSIQNAFGALTATETKTTALGAEYRVIVTHSETFHTKQSRGFDQRFPRPVEHSSPCPGDSSEARPERTATPWRPRSPEYSERGGSLG